MLGLRLGPFLCATLLVLIAFGCGRHKRMTDDSVDIVKDMLFLLEENVENPERAVPAFREFLMENRLRMMSLRQISQEQGQTLTREDRIRMNVRFLQKLEPYKKRLNAVAKVYKDRPEVLKKMREVIQSLSFRSE